MLNIYNSVAELLCTSSCGYKHGIRYDAEILLKAESNRSCP